MTNKPYTFKGGEPIPDSHFENDYTPPKGGVKLSPEEQKAFDEGTARSQALIKKLRADRGEQV